MRKIIDKIIEVMCAAIMGYMVLAVCWQVVTRFVLKNPSTVTEEILRYLLVWTTMVGGAYAYGRREHLLHQHADQRSCRHAVKSARHFRYRQSLSRLPALLS